MIKSYCRIHTFIREVFDFNLNVFDMKFISFKNVKSKIRTINAHVILKIILVQKIISSYLKDLGAHRISYQDPPFEMLV